MTENEAKKWINALKNWNSILPEAQEACEMAEKCLEELKQYRAIGTVEEFRELKEKSIAKKPNRKPNPNWTNEEITCPNCSKYVSSKYTDAYCECGQKLDWE